VDNGYPWGAPGGLPTSLSLWAAGLGVQTHWNDPYQPQQNGVVERSQGTSERWAEPGACRDVGQLRQRVAEEDWIQREVYPAIEGQSRRAAYPALLHSGRGYSRGWEELVWDLDEALAFLARYRVRRKVNRQGKVSVYDRGVAVGSEYAGGWAFVRLDPQAREWVIANKEGAELRRRPAPQLTREAIVGLGVSRPHTSSLA
jgi:hypothetical protein